MSETRIIRVKVKPNAGRSILEPPGADGVWLARLKSSPVDGKANDELVKLVAKHLCLPRKAVTITAGHTSRLKRLHIANPC